MRGCLDKSGNQGSPIHVLQKSFFQDAEHALFTVVTVTYTIATCNVVLGVFAVSFQAGHGKQC